MQGYRATPPPDCNSSDRTKDERNWTKDWTRGWTKDPAICNVFGQIIIYGPLFLSDYLSEPLSNISSLASKVLAARGRRTMAIELNSRLLYNPGEINHFIFVLR